MEGQELETEVRTCQCCVTGGPVQGLKTESAFIICRLWGGEFTHWKWMLGGASCHLQT